MRRCVKLLVMLVVSPLCDANSFAYLEGTDALVYGGGAYFSETRDVNDMSALYLRLLDADTSELLYRGEGGLTDVKLSPGNELIAVIEHSKTQVSSRDQSNYVSREYDRTGNLIDYYYNVQSDLRILNLQGDLIASIPDVRRFVWDSRAQQIAYLTGTEYEGGFGFLSTGAWIYDIVERKAERIHSGGYDVQWAAWDGNIYILDAGNDAFPGTSVFRFDTTTRDISPTSHEGIYFSPLGRYYFAQGYEATPLRVFETETGREVEVDISVDVPDLPGRTQEMFMAAGWLDDDTLIVPTPFSGDRGDYLYRVFERTLWQAAGRILPTRPPGGGRCSSPREWPGEWLRCSGR